MCLLHTFKMEIIRSFCRKLLEVFVVAAKSVSELLISMDDRKIIVSCDYTQPPFTILIKATRFHTNMLCPTICWKLWNSILDGSI